MLVSIVAAGVLALPALLVQVVSGVAVAILSVPSLCLLQFRKPSSSAAASKSLHGAHVVITGGSSGIGLALAKESVQRGASHVTILARNVKKLEAAKQELESARKSDVTTTIQALSVDVSNLKSLEDAAKKLFASSSTAENNDSKNGSNSKIYLFCCAGTTRPKYFEQHTAADFESVIQTNQLGSMYTAKAFLPYMLENNNSNKNNKNNSSGGGTICFCSSVCGQIGIFGYSSYSPTKFAVRGFAEVLHMELCNRPIHIQVAYPPDTDTPGFEVENIEKPEETKVISEQGGLFSAAQVARTMLHEATARNPRFNVYFNFEGWMLAALSAGMSPPTTLGDAVTQVAGMSLFRFVGLFYLNDWWRLIRNYQNEKQAAEAKTK